MLDTLLQRLVLTIQNTGRRRGELADEEQVAACDLIGANAAQCGVSQIRLRICGSFWPSAALLFLAWCTPWGDRRSPLLVIAPFRSVIPCPASTDVLRIPSGQVRLPEPRLSVDNLG